MKEAPKAAEKPAAEKPAAEKPKAGADGKTPSDGKVAGLGPGRAFLWFSCFGFRLPREC